MTFFNEWLMPAAVNAFLIILYLFAIERNL